MVISHRHKFIFFSNPKTGSESIRQLLQNFQEENIVPYYKHMDEGTFYPHMTPYEAQKVFQQKEWNFDEYFKFVFTRNPWERMTSLYEMIKRNREIELGPKYFFPFIFSHLIPHKGDLRFKYWLRTIEVDGLGGGGSDSSRWRKYGAYSVENYVSNDRGIRLVDAVVRLENVKEELPLIFEIIGLPKQLVSQLPCKNKHRTKHYSRYYDKDSRSLVANLYRSDIEEFGYTFENR